MELFEQLTEDHVDFIKDQKVFFVATAVENGTINLSPKDLQNIIPFQDPAPAREISMIYSKSQLKLPVINALMSTISSVIRGQIKYNDIKIMSPVSV